MGWWWRRRRHQLLPVKKKKLIPSQKHVLYDVYHFMFCDEMVLYDVYGMSRDMETWIDQKMTRETIEKYQVEQPTRAAPWS